jgi:hypothetical protein
VTLLMGVRALRRADARAWPPRSGALPARIGIVLSTFGLLVWLAMVVTVVRDLTR